ncbi:hypothetical protein ACWV2X_25780 [Streptomyces hydrogenans]
MPRRGGSGRSRAPWAASATALTWRSSASRRCRAWLETAAARATMASTTWLARAAGSSESPRAAARAALAAIASPPIAAVPRALQVAAASAGAAIRKRSNRSCGGVSTSATVARAITRNGSSRPSR